MGSQYDRQKWKAEDSSLAEALGLCPPFCNLDLLYEQRVFVQHRYDPLFSSFLSRNRRCAILFGDSLYYTRNQSKDNVKSPFKPTAAALVGSNSQYGQIHQGLKHQC